MEKNEINEPRKLFTLEKCGISKVVGCYVNGDKVKLELSTYDLTKGRITWRGK